MDDGLEEPRREHRPGELHDDVARDSPPREVAAQREGDAHGRVEMRAGHLAHEQDDRHHHESRRDDGRVPADRVREGLAHHPAAGGDEHEEEGAEQLREEPPPFLRRVLEVGHRVDDLDLEPPIEPAATCCLRLVDHHHPYPSEQGIKAPTAGECSRPDGREPRPGTLREQRGVDARLLCSAACRRQTPR